MQRMTGKYFGGRLRQMRDTDDEIRGRHAPVGHHFNETRFSLLSGGLCRVPLQPTNNNLVRVAHSQVPQGPWGS